MSDTKSEDATGSEDSERPVPPASGSESASLNGKSTPDPAPTKPIPAPGPATTPARPPQPKGPALAPIPTGKAPTVSFPD